MERKKEKERECMNLMIISLPFNLLLNFAFSPPSWQKLCVRPETHKHTDTHAQHAYIHTIRRNRTLRFTTKHTKTALQRFGIEGNTFRRKAWHLLNGPCMWDKQTASSQHEVEWLRITASSLILLLTWRTGEWALSCFHSPPTHCCLCHWTLPCPALRCQQPTPRKGGN